MHSHITIGVVLMLIYIACKNETSFLESKPVTVKTETQWQNAFIEKDLDIKTLLKTDTILSAIISTAILGNNGGINDSLLASYIKSEQRKKLMDTCMAVFKGFNWQQSLSLPFGRYLASFPDKTTPILYPLITDFNYGIFQFENQNHEDAIGIGLEMFLGNTALYDQLSIQNPNFSSYINRTFNLTYLPSKIMYAIAGDQMSEPSSNRLIDHIIHEGKKLYLVKAWMPDLPDTIWYECTTLQMDWIKSNELDMWRFLLTDKLLYKNSSKEIANLTQPAPYSQGMPPEAPGRAVNYIGYKIIEGYIKNTHSSLPAMAVEKNFDRILSESKYKPK